MKTNNYRPLFQEEIRQLESQGCTAEDWTQIYVSPDFLPGRVHFAHFSGSIRLGSFCGQFILSDGMVKPCGIYQATLHNVTLADHCRIADVKDYIANYRIASHVRIEHIHSLRVDGLSSFGNGVRIAVLNEAGGREVCMHDALSAQVAYLQCHYRHDEDLQQRLLGMADTYSQSRTSSWGEIGTQSLLTHTGNIHNVQIGEWAVIDGVQELKEGTVCSTKEAPSQVGPGVIARQFIFKAGSKVLDNAHLTRCFVGEASYIGRGFTATDSLIFSNCHFENGEACALFAGPFTVSHHKSTLLIGMMASFMNAGSGTNQSNHAYKLGPIHYGILERGCRTGSGSYLLWPSRIGAFSTVIGSVKTHIDTSSFPFSYVIGEGSKVYVAPGATLRSIGTWRDAEKWPLRDGRKNPVRADVVDMEILSPYTVGKMRDALDQLRALQNEYGAEFEEYPLPGFRIRRSSLEHGIRLYEQATRYWAGNQLLEMTKKAQLAGSDDQFRQWVEEIPDGNPWVDIAGMYLTPEVLDLLLEPLRNGTLATPHEVNETFRRAADEYPVWSVSSVCSLLLRIWENPLRSSSDIRAAIELWQKDSLELFLAVWQDGCKEFAPLMQLASGMDACNPARRNDDFEKAGGRIADHPFMDQISQRMEQIKTEAAALLKKL